MNEIQEKCFGILQEIDRLCKGAGITYYIYAGTLLGAVRHGGFIPWDDDIDVIMPRKDYDRFLEVCKRELNDSTFFIQTTETDPLTNNPWAKLHDANTAFISGIRRAGTAEGINIDIFPVDNAPDNRFVRKLRGKVIDSCNYIYQFRFGKHSKESSKKMKLFQFLVGLIPPWSEKRFKKCYEKYLRRFNNRQTENVVYLSNRKYTRKVIPASWLNESVELAFEGEKFMAPKDWRKILKSLYGEDYMKLPPIEERQTVHGTKIVDLKRSWREYYHEQ